MSGEVPRRSLGGAALAATAWAALGAGQASAAPTPAKPAPAVPNPVADALALPSGTESIALWGSSSMEGGLGAEHTPRPVFVHDELALTFNPTPVYNVAYGAQWSNHTTILRGLDTPMVHLPSEYRGGKVKVQVDTPVPGLWSFTCHGTLSSGVSGTLTGSGTNTWYFEADSPGPATSGTFKSSWARTTASSRHVIWTGKNNIHDLELVLSDIDRIAKAARDPERDVIILGQWVTKKDLAFPNMIEKMHEANRIHAEKYGRRFIDVQKLLTGKDAFEADPIRELALVKERDTLAELKAGIVPTPLRGSDGVHLSGWGNLLVSEALVARMKELAWR